LEKKDKRKQLCFNGDNGDFILEDPQKTSYLYFPLANEAGMMSSITPTLNGDIKSGLNTFFMTPVSSDDLHNTRSARNFWIYIDGFGPWSATGNSPMQIAMTFDEKSEEEVNVECGFLWHKVTRKNAKTRLNFEVTNFVPTTEDKVELMRVKITNTGNECVSFTPTAAIPIFGRSADNIRDHRHLTSLLHRIYTTENGIEVHPTLSFDERGHKPNNITYCVFGADEDGNPPLGSFPLLESFIGEGGCLEWPEVVVKNKDNYYEKGRKLDGGEAIGALRFKSVALKAGQTKSYIIAMIISDSGVSINNLINKYCSDISFDAYLQKNKDYWQKKLSKIVFTTGNKDFDLWMKWVTVQPMLRKIYGCSFLPHHDYGRGGRGWRDLWQDCLALLIMEPQEVRDLLINNFSGIRIDGSNATIIGAKPGEFAADRNNIPRTWMDHGAWPLLTTKLYIDQSGDLGILLEEQYYFKDGFIKRAKEKDNDWNIEYGNRLKTKNDEFYKGNIVEHILVQNLVSFFNVGEHNNIRLEDADWNDCIDMAPERGESVAFTALYGNNLMDLAKLLIELETSQGIKEIEIAAELFVLLDTISGKVNYDSVDEKQVLLIKYYNSCLYNISGEKSKVKIRQLVNDLEEKSNWICDHIRNNEWIKNSDGYEWFNGYYDNDGKRLEGDNPNGVRMTLTGQVFTVRSGIATNEQVKKIIKSVNKYLKDPKIGGYRLNTNFGETLLNLGRGTGFAFGHKENGSIFCHMAVMYANALYIRGFVNEGYDVLKSLSDLSMNFDNSKIYPAIPEYINENGRGMYNYITGSASWYLLTMLTEVFGVKGRLGDLLLEPKLLKEQFDVHQVAKVYTIFADKKLHIVYENPNSLEYGQYKIHTLKLNGITLDAKNDGNLAIIKRNLINGLNENDLHVIKIGLCTKHVVCDIME
jgi:cellobiose phosphorylase